MLMSLAMWDEPLKSLVFCGAFSYIIIRSVSAACSKDFCVIHHTLCYPFLPVSIHNFLADFKRINCRYHYVCDLRYSRC